MSDDGPDLGSNPVPPVGHPRLAESLQRISDLDAQPLAEHHDRLVEVHEVLQAVLHPDSAAG